MDTCTTTNRPRSPPKRTNLALSPAPPPPLQTLAPANPPVRKLLDSSSVGRGSSFRGGIV